MNHCTSHPNLSPINTATHPPLQVEALQHENIALAAELNEVRNAAGNLHSALEEAEARGAQLHMQLLAAGTREEELSQVGGRGESWCQWIVPSGQWLLAECERWHRLIN